MSESVWVIEQGERIVGVYTKREYAEEVAEKINDAEKTTGTGTDMYRATVAEWP